MSDQRLEELGINRENAAAAQDFFESYGRLCESELSRIDVARGAGGTDLDWQAAMDGASAYRDAATWALARADGQLARLLSHAAALYSRAGQPYGFFVHAVAQRVGSDVAGAFGTSDVRNLAAAVGLPEFGNTPSGAWESPQQQVYAFLAAASESELNESDRQTLLLVGESAVLRESTAPVGALGTPVIEFCDVGNAMLRDAPSTALSLVIATVARMCERFAQAADLARRNTYLWSRAASPFDVGDLDVFGVIALAVSKYGADGVREVAKAETLSYLARQQLEIALEVAAPGPQEEVLA
jgi:hypothetical protein